MRPGRSIFSVATAIIAQVSTPAASAQVVYDSSVGGASSVANAFVSDTDPQQIIVDNVTLPQNQHVTAIEWTGVYLHGDNLPSVEDDFTITIRTDNSSVPGALIASFPVGASVNRALSGSLLQGSLPIYNYTAEISFTFDANTLYWIGLENSFGPRDDDSWAWATTELFDGISRISIDQGVSWNGLRVDADFRLLNSSPPCQLDLNSDGILDNGDIITFVNLFIQGDIRADVNSDGLICNGDIGYFVVVFLAGC